MAKTVYSNNYSDLKFGYAVDTVVIDSEFLLSNDDPPEQIGTKVYVQSLSGVDFSTLLAIGIVQVVVTAIGSDDGGQFLTCTELITPSAGTAVRTPWNAIGSLLVTRADNSITLRYYIPAEHDLYFRTLRTPDSGAIQVSVDGSSIGDFALTSDTAHPDSVLLANDIPSGTHVVTIATAVSPALPFIYFDAIELLEHDVETGGEYLYYGPSGTIDTSANNFLGQWGTLSGYTYTTDTASRIYFYPQLGFNGRVSIRVQTTPDSAIAALYVNGAWRKDIDLYSDATVPLFEVTVLDTASGDTPGRYKIELRHTGNTNAASTGMFLYFHSTVVIYSRTDHEALILAANYLKQVAAIRGDGAFVDAWDSVLINFDATALYACMGLIAAYEATLDTTYLDSVKAFLLWFAGMQSTDGSWSIGYEVNPSGSPAYIATSGPYAQQGISEIKWVDAVQCLPSFILWWYWKHTGDTSTRDALLPVFTRALDGFIDNNYDAESGFFFSSWQNKTAPTIFLYHDAIRRYNPLAVLIEERNDTDGSFTYQGGWSSYAPAGAINNDEHYTLNSGAYVQFSIALAAGDQLRWVTQKAWDTGIARVLVATDGLTFTQHALIDTFGSSLTLGVEVPLFVAPLAGTYWFRIQHTGTINAAGNIVQGWQRLPSRFSAGQTDVAIGLTALWLMTRKPRYAELARRIIERIPERYWSTTDQRWSISLDGPGAGSPNDFWYPMTHGYTVFGNRLSRFFQPVRLFADGLRALETYQDAEGGFHPPGYTEPEYIFSAFYVVGENQLTEPTSIPALTAAKEHLKSGQYLLDVSGEQVGGILFSKRYQYLYTNIAGFACLALSGSTTPITQQLRIGTTRLITAQ
jgi:hypothetical protein